MDKQGTYHSDNDTLRLFCTQERKAVKAIYEDCFPLISRMVTKNWGRREDAEDVFQEGLIVLMGYCGKQDFRLTVSLKSFFYTICRNIWLKKLEKKGRLQITFVDIWEHAKLDHALEEQENAELKAEQLLLLWKHFSRLPLKEQETLRLFYLEGKSHREIAEIVGFVDENSAKVQKFKYVNHLRELVKNDPDFD